MATKKATKTVAKKSPAKAAKAPAKSAAKKSAASETTQEAAAKTPPTHGEIAHRAVQLWNERGRPHGSAHIDWHKAEEELKG